MSSNILDAPGESFPVFKSRVGGAFATPAMYVSPVCMGLGFVLLMASLWGLALFLIGALGLTASSWVAIDPVNKRIREYSQWFGLKSGDWKALPPVRCVTIVRIKTSKEVPGPRMLWPMLTIEDHLYKVQLIEKEKRKSWPVSKLKNKEDAFRKAKQIADLLQLELFDYTESGNIPSKSGRRR